MKSKAKMVYRKLQGYGLVKIKWWSIWKNNDTVM